MHSCVALHLSERWRPAASCMDTLVSAAQTGLCCVSFSEALSRWQSTLEITQNKKHVIPSTATLS